MQEHERVVPMEGIHNFRDYGGYRGRSGILRCGTLWRSGQHSEATAADLDKVHALGIRTVFDLRGDSERALNPCLRHEEFDGTVLFEPGETAGSKGEAAHEEAAREVRTAADAHAAMIRLYQAMPWRPVLVGTYRLTFDALAEREGASLLHCLAGKDRTGLGAALVHHLLGVHPDEAMTDYLLTNTAGDAEARVAAGIRHVRAGFGPAMDDAAVRTLMSVHPAFLDTALDAIRARHGSITVYADEVLGVGAEMLARIESRLVE